MIFISVLLPAPFSPARPWISPTCSEKSTPRSACTPPNDFGDAGEFEQRRTHRGGTCKRFAQMRNWSSIHSMPSALALVTTGPSVTMFFGMSVPVLAPLTTADTPAMIAPP